MIDTVGPSWGWLVGFSWLMYQLYNPFYQTKLQQYHHDLSARFHRVEVVQVAISEEIDGIDEDFVKELHGQSGLSTNDLKQREKDPR